MEIGSYPREDLQDLLLELSDGLLSYVRGLISSQRE